MPRVTAVDSTQQLRATPVWPRAGETYPARVWARWKDGAYGRIGRDLNTRMAHLMGVHKGLRYLFKDPARGFAWIKKPNSAFEAQSALQLMLRGEISDLAALRARRVRASWRARLGSIGCKPQ